jgi:hypothetical protein
VDKPLRDSLKFTSSSSLIPVSKKNIMMEKLCNLSQVASRLADKTMMNDKVRFSSFSGINP